MNYLNKIKPYPFKEKFQLLKFSFGSILISSVPKGLKTCYLLSNELLDHNIQVKGTKENIGFDYQVSETLIHFQLKRNSSDASVFRQIILEEEYQTIKDLFTKHSVSPHFMIDAGANIGLTSLYFKAHFPNLKIVALEPAEGTFKRLELNIEKNNFKDVTLFQKGLWDKETRLKEDRSFRDGEDWSFRLVEASEKEKALFETTTVFNLLKEQAMDIVDFLKIDIEGGEDTVFSANSNFTWLSRIRIIAIEIHDEFNCRERIESILRENHFGLSYSGELTIGINNRII